MVEVLYSRKGQTADQMIERAVHRFEPYGEVLVVTEDRAERDLVVSLGGSVATPVVTVSSRTSKMPWRTWETRLNITTVESGKGFSGRGSRLFQKE